MFYTIDIYVPQIYSEPMKLTVRYTNSVGREASRFFWAPAADVRKSVRELAAQVHAWGGQVVSAYDESTRTRYDAAGVAELAMEAK